MNLRIVAVAFAALAALAPAAVRAQEVPPPPPEPDAAEAPAAPAPPPDQSASATTPAPPSEAEAHAAQAELGGGQVAAVGHTEAEAGEGEDQNSAHAGAVEVGDEPPPAEQFGGTQEGPGASSGAVIDTGGTGFDELGRIAVAPWSAQVSEDATGRHSRAHASLLELLVAPGGTRVLEFRVLTSDTAADYLASRSTGRASTDGVVLILGDPADPERSLVVHIFHSEANSEAGSRTYLIDINGNTVGANDDDLGAGLAQICGAINIPGLLRLFCVQASGGVAEFAQAALGDGAEQGGTLRLFGVAVAGGDAAEAPAPTPPPDAGGAPAPPSASVLGATVSGPETPRAAPTEAAGAGATPRTGAGSVLSAALVMLGLAFLMAGRLTRLTPSSARA